MESLASMLQVDFASFTYVTVVVVTATAGLIDAYRKLIPNAVTYGLMIFGLVYHVVSPLGEGLWFTLAGGGLGLALLLPLFVMGGVGAGDVKLLTGIGCCVGPHDALAIFLVIGFLLGAIVLLVRFRERIASRGRAGLVSQPFPSERIEDALAREHVAGGQLVIPMAPIMAVSLLLLAAWPIADGFMTGSFPFV